MADRSWPPGLIFSDLAFWIAAPTRTGGQSLDGSEQVVVSPSARWKASGTIPIADRRHGPVERQNAVLAYRSLVRGGRAATIIVPCREGRGPAHQAGIVPCRSGAPFSDDATFSDDSRFAQTFTGAALAEAAVLNAVRIAITLPAGLSPLPGMRFSTPDHRLHEVDDILSFDGATRWVVTVAPWLRAAYPAGTALDFDAPRCRMRLASDETGQLSLSLNRFARPSIEFVEAF